MEIFRKKNEATELTFPAVDSTTPSTFKTGISPVDTAYYEDGGGWQTLAISDTATEIGSTGMYQLSMAQAEMNHDLIAIKFAVSGMADTMLIIRTRAVDLDDLVRSTTPANTLDINATGEAGIDLDNTSGTLAKTTDITGFNDIAATAVVSSGAINTSSGAVSQVTTSVNLTTNNDKTGYTIDTNNDKTGYSIADSTSDAVIADAVWNALTASYGIADSYGALVEGFTGDATAANQTTIINDIAVTNGRLTAARGGYLDNLNGHTAQTGDSYSVVNTNLDAAITSRSSHSAADVWAVGTRALTDKAGFSLTADQGSVTIGTVTSNTDMRGTENAFLAANAPTNFSDLAITITTGKMTVGTNDDKSDYNLVADQSAVTVGNITNDVGITQAGADKAWGTAARTLTASTNFNDISSADVNTEVDAALDTAFTDATGLTTNGLKERMRALMWVLRNKMEVTDANGNTVIYKDDGITEAVNVLAALTDDATTTTRKRVV